LVGAVSFTIRIFCVPKSSYANGPPGYRAGHPHDLEQFGRFVRRGLPIRPKRFDRYGATASKGHLHSEAASLIAKIPDTRPFREWLAGAVNPLYFNLGIY